MGTFFLFIHIHIDISLIILYKMLIWKWEFTKNLTKNITSALNVQYNYQSYNIICIIYSYIPYTVLPCSHCIIDAF